jgi:hypothetical protein
MTFNVTLFANANRFSLLANQTEDILLNCEENSPLFIFIEARNLRFLCYIFQYRMSQLSLFII